MSFGDQIIGFKKRMHFRVKKTEIRNHGSKTNLLQVTWLSKSGISTVSL